MQSLFLHDVKPRAKDAPGTSCLLRLIGVPNGTTNKELNDAIEPFGKIYTAILLKAIREVEMCLSFVVLFALIFECAGS